MDTTVMRAGTADVIAYVFYTLGYRPRESLVLVGLQGPRRRIGMCVRMDLPPSRDVRRPLEQALTALRQHGDDAVIVLVVSDRQVRGKVDPCRPPHAYLARDVRRRLMAAGVRVWDVLAVGPSTYRSYLCPEPNCCPAEGRPLAEATGGALAAWMISHGRSVAPDEASVLEFVEPTVSPDPRQAGPTLLSGSAEESLRRWRALLHDGSPSWSSPEPASRGEFPDVRWLADALQDHWFRDAVLLTLVPDAETVADEALCGVDAAAMDGLFDKPPDDDLLQRGTALLAAVARTAPPGQRADALALLAWASWWAGEGARGRLLAARALADQPAHTLAALVDQLLFVGVPPGWASRRSRAG
ncbi:MAG TPA: DUF4192 domain-containing protein [Kineosporiaceae bacterium]